MPEKDHPWRCLHVSSAGAQAQSLIWDLRSCMPCDAAKKKKGRKTKENPRDHFRVLLFPETFHVHGCKNPHKGLKAKKIRSLIAQKSGRIRGWVAGSRELNGLSRNYKSLLKVENIWQAYSV